MTGASNQLAAAFAHAPIDPRVARELWERGGRQVSEHHPSPVRATDVKSFSAGDAAAAARHLTDPVELGHIWQSDRRIAVRKAVLDNPNIPPATALAGMAWLLDRGETVHHSLMERADLDEVIELMGSHSRTGDDMYGDPVNTAGSVTDGHLSRWAYALGVDRLDELAPRAWLAEVAAWTMVCGVDAGFVTDDDVDELWQRCSSPARHFALRRLTDDVGFSRRWLARLAGHGATVATVLRKDRFSALPVEAPELLVGLCDGLDQADAPALLRWFVETERRFRRADAPDGDDLSTPTEVGDALAEVLADAWASSHGKVSRDDLEWLATRTSSASAAAMAKVFEAHGPAGWRRSTGLGGAYGSYLSRVEVGGNVVDVLRASKSAELVRLWLRGVYSPNQPTVDLVADLVRAEPGVIVCEVVAPYPQLWAVHPDVAELVVAQDVALGALLGSTACPPEVPAALLERAAGRPVTPAGSGWVANVVAAVDAAGAYSAPGKIGIEPAAALLECWEVPEELRVELARQGDVVAELCSGKYELNPPTLTAIGGDAEFWTATGDSNPEAQSGAFAALASNSSAAPELRARAALHLGGVEYTAVEVAEAGPLSVELLSALAAKAPAFLGRWLGGGFEANPPNVDAALAVAEQLADAEKLTAATMYARSSRGRERDPRVLEWISALPGIFAGVARQDLMDLVAELARVRLGDDVAAWLAFAELAEGSDRSLDEVLDVVEVVGSDAA